MTRRLLAPLAAASGAAFLLLAVLVARGSCASLDRYAVTNLMPWIGSHFETGISVADLTLPGTKPTAGGTLVDLWTYPAAALPSLLLVLLAAAVLWRRAEVTAAAIWACAWVAGNVVELAGKTIVARPALESHGVHVTPFDQSYPSGHALRSLIVAAALVWTWHRAWPLLAWALTIPVALVALGAHTPTDVAGGVLAAIAVASVAALACFAAEAAGRSETEPAASRWGPT